MARRSRGAVAALTLPSTDGNYSYQRKKTKLVYIIIDLIWCWGCILSMPYQKQWTFNEALLNISTQLKFQRTEFVFDYNAW